MNVMTHVRSQQMRTERGVGITIIAAGYLL